MAATVTGTPVLHPGSSGGEATGTESITVPSGATKMLVMAGLRRTPTLTITGVTFNGSEAFTQVVRATGGADDAMADMWYLDNPTVTTANIVVTWSASGRGGYAALCLAGTVSGTATATANAANSSALAVASTADGIVVSNYIIDTGDTTTAALTAGTSQANHILAAGAGSLSCRQGVATQAGTGSNVSTTWTPTGDGSIPVHIVAAFTATAVGPTIDTQPTAGTVVLNGYGTAVQSKTFTVAATTSGGTLTYQWQQEDSVGAGTYTNVSNGGIYSGVTTASMVVTPTTKTGLTGKKMRCNVTDDNGTTATTGVVLTAYTGLLFASATSAINGSGVGTVTATTDYPVSANGAFQKLTATSAGVTSRTATRPA